MNDIFPPFSKFPLTDGVERKPIGALLLFTREQHDAFFEESENQRSDGFGVFSMRKFHRDGQTYLVNPHKNGQMIEARFSCEEDALETISNIRAFGITRAISKSVPKYKESPLGDGAATVNPEWVNAPYIAIMGYIDGAQEAPKEPCNVDHFTEKILWKNNT